MVYRPKTSILKSKSHLNTEYVGAGLTDSGIDIGVSLNDDQNTKDVFKVLSTPHFPQLNAESND